MKTYADKTQENTSRSIASEPSQRQLHGTLAFQFIDNRPETAAQKKMQELANNSSRAKQAAQLHGKAGGNVAQLVEAGAQPIRVNMDDEDNQLSINGLINCVGVVIMIYGEDDKKFDHVAAVGGHFVTPEMYQFGYQRGFTGSGQTFLNGITTLINGIDRDRLEATYYIKTPAVSGGSSNAYEEAMEAATAIKTHFDLGGQVEEISGNISVAV